ncbi:MAG: polysaccharide deacetylase family protein [Candidatus Thorarchaeota archaeon]|nr:polysaccharide deacetylase family protein [Candidatus Thorarchaeota archaeon]
MVRLHRTPFTTILRNMFEVLEAHHARFAFPVVAAVARMRPELIREILEAGHEVASHGYNHVRYPQMSPEKRKRDLALSLQSLRRLGATVKGFRAPYDNYTDDMPEMLSVSGLAWDGGFGYRPEHRDKSEPFKVSITGGQTGTTFIPLSVWSDDLMIDTLGWRPGQVTKQLGREVQRAAEHGGVLMFDLHPIRIGQREYVGCLDATLELAMHLGAWCPTPAEAVEYWNKHRRWKSDSSFCLLLTGDIDNWTFADYVRRTLWQRALSQNQT